MTPMIWVLVVAATLNLNGKFSQAAVVESTFRTEKECLEAKAAKDKGTAGAEDIPAEITRFGGACVVVPADIVNKNAVKPLQV